MPAIVVIGEALVDFFAEPGCDLASASGFIARPGGAPANVAACAGRLGAHVGFIGKVGQDGFGAALRSQLSRVGVDTAHLKAEPGAPTMIAVVALPTPNTPEFVLYSAANAALTPADIEPGYLADCKVLVFGSVTLAYASADAVLQAARLVRDRGAEVVFDVNLRPSIWADLAVAKAQIETAVALATVIKLSAAEASFLFGGVTDDEAAKAIVDGGAKLCCVTRGEGGTLFRTARFGAHVPAVPVDTVDATGAGDAFVAGLALGFVEGTAPPDRLPLGELTDIIAFANGCGAFVATRLGAMDAPITRAAVRELLASADLTARPLTSMA